MQLLVVLHTHWDREWYFTTSDSLVLMDRTFKNIINELELYPEISFCLDGQYSIIEEFLSINKHLESQVQKLVIQERLYIGPWYTQTDAQLVNGESIIRNLYYGMHQTKERFGKVMEVGYLPDTFGFNSELPEILKLGGIDKAIIWRGTDLRGDLKPYFNWVGQSGDKVKCLNFYGGYGMAKGLEDTDLYYERTIKRIVDDYQNLGIESSIVIPVGNDQFEIVPDILEKMERLNNKHGIHLEMSNYEAVFDEVFNGDEQDYVGEFRATHHTRIHKSIGSVRMDLKSDNYEVEQLLLNQVEPLMAYCHYNEIDVNPHLLYKAWKLLFEGHAHDGICGCVSDDVAKDMKNRIKQAREIGLSILNMLNKQLAEIVELQAGEVLIFNPSPYPKSLHEFVYITEDENIEVLDVNNFEIKSTKLCLGKEEALVETPIGNHTEVQNDYYEHTALVDKEIKPMQLEVVKVSKSQNSISPSIINELSFNNFSLKFENGFINLAQGESVIKDFISIIHQSNDGDTYDFSPVIGEVEERIDFQDCIIRERNLSTEMVISGIAKLRYSMTDDTLVDCPYELKISKFLGQKININFIIDNNVLSHRLRIKIKTDQDISQVVSSNTHSTVTRKCNLETAINWQTNNVEKPVNIEVFDGFLQANQFTFLNGNSREYEVVNQDILFTTLATTSHLGKSNLVNRPGRASGDVSKKGHIDILTPLAECNQVMYHEMAIIIGEVNNPFKEVDDYRYKALNYQQQECNKFYNRIDNKIMPYRGLEKRPLTFPCVESNGFITNIGFNLDKKVTIRGIATSDNFCQVDGKKLHSVDILGRKNDIINNNIFNYEME